MSIKYDYFEIGLASPEEILSWSHGEVKKHETINYRTLKPEKDGLFCEVIFGPTKDKHCACGRNHKDVKRGDKCPKCGVENTSSKVRRERMGHIKLAAPVVHIWYLKNSPSKIALLLNMKPKVVEEVVYLASYVVTDPGDTQVTKLSKGQVLSELEYSEYSMRFPCEFEAKTGAEAIELLLKDLDLEKEAITLRADIRTASKQKREQLIKRINIVESFNNSNNKPEWMILGIIPVIPPDLRPMVALDGGRFATTDLNDLYRRVLNRNNRLKTQFMKNAPHLITKNEKRMLQEAVDALIDNSKRGRRAAVEKNRPLKSLSDMLRGKQGRFRQNLLGKRVDYSGRSVIVVGPDLKMYQCGIPKEMALKLFKPFVLRELLMREDGTNNMKRANTIIDEKKDIVWTVLEQVIREHPVLLNRAPTLHRLGIQAFEPKLVEGKAIRLHPLVTPAFNADFDGDQMAVHVPLSEEAQAEARLLMLASNNILNPKDGAPVVTPSQDMVLGNYYLTMENYDKENVRVFNDFNEAEMAFENGYITLHTLIFVNTDSIGILAEDHPNKYLLTTYGKLIFNRILPETFGYVNEPTNANLLNGVDARFIFDRNTKLDDVIEPMLEKDSDGNAKDYIVKPFGKKFLGDIIAEVFSRFKITETSKMLDKLKDLGFEYSTVAGITVSADDVKVYSKKQEVISDADSKVAKIHALYDKGLCTDKERYNLVVKVWESAKDEIQTKLMLELPEDNHISMMSASGARGNASNFTQLAGMRGLMAKSIRTSDLVKAKAGLIDVRGVVEIPIKSSFREGLTMSEFFNSTHGARKGSTDTALKTADSGYLTRRLVDVSQDVIVRKSDCGTDKGLYVTAIYDDKSKENPNPDQIESLSDRINGRYASKDVYHPETGELIVARNVYIDDKITKEIVNAKIEGVFVRTAFTCDLDDGVCKHCYGKNLATGDIVEVGEAVGIIAAQSIGEPGTQLTMRTFHTGGVASGADITQGLPRIQEIVEAREPKNCALITDIDGVVKSITPNTEKDRVIVVENSLETKEYKLVGVARPIVEVGQELKAGDPITPGYLNLKKLYAVSSRERVEQYMLKEVQKVYRIQGIEIADKHIEIIIRQMMRKVKVKDTGETDLLPGVEVSINEFKQENYKALREGKRLAKGIPLLLGITRASLRSQSFLSAASFQETTRILTDAAIRGKRDLLSGLKENVIIGGLIPAGTGNLSVSDMNCADENQNNEFGYEDEEYQLTDDFDSNFDMDYSADFE